MFDDKKDLYRPETQNENARTHILMITADKTEDLEFFYPYYRFLEAGYAVDVATPEGKGFKAKHELGLKETRKIADMDTGKYALLYIPGGKAPEALKKDEAATDIVRSFAASNKPIAAICHGAQLLAKAGVIKGKKIAAWPEVKDEVEAAGATYMDEESVIDGQFITGRWPGDLPMHMKRTLEVLSRAAGQGRKSAAA